MSFDNVKIFDLDFAADAAILADTQEIGALETLSTELEPLGLRLYWVKTKIQIFIDNLDDAIEFASVSGLGQVAAWRMSSRRPKEYRKKIDAAPHY